MSARELRRAGVLARVAAGTLTLKAAAVLMDVSYRQAKRLYRPVSGGRGARRCSIGVRVARRIGRWRGGSGTRVLALIREKYSGDVDERFGPTLAAEHLASEDGVHGRSRDAAAVDVGGGPVESRAEAIAASPASRAQAASR